MQQAILTALRAGDAATALATAQRWTQAEPANPEALVWLAHAQGTAGDLAAAAAAVDGALALAPDRADLLTLRAYLDLQARDYGKAEAGLGAALAQDPNQFSAYIALANLALARGDRTEAERLVTLAKRIDANHPRLLLLDAQLAAGQGQDDRVLPLLLRAAERAPTDPLVMSALGLAFLERRNFAFAVEGLRRALALSGAAPTLHGALVAALEAQGHDDQALEAAEAWVAARPGLPPALWTRARLRVKNAQWADALDDLEAVLAVLPRHPEAFDLAMQVRGRLEGPEALIAAVESRALADPGFAPAWRLLMNLSPVEDSPALSRRWLEAAPGNPAALEVAAVIAEREGRQAEAEALAQQALAAEPNLREAALLLGRATALLAPEAAVARMDALLAGAVNPEQARALAGWQGQALHRVGRVEDALRAWGRMWMAGPAFGVPLSNPEPASVATPTEDGGAGLLLWGPPGSRIERVHAALIPAAPQRLMIDRFQRPLRDDGFQALRVAPNHERAGTAARWRAPLEALGLQPADMIDALPFWDGWTQATLHGTTLVAVLRDPRDLLLNWMAWGSAASFTFPAPSVAAAWLHRLLEQLLEVEAAHPERVRRIDADLLDRDPAAFAARLTEVFGLEAAPDLAAAQAMARAANGGPTDFPAGTWRQYAGPMKGLFAPLAPLAVRLGYPAE